MKTTKMFAVGLGVVVMLGACGSGKSSASKKNRGTTPSTASSSAPTVPVNYHPVIDPAQFSTTVTNKYFPMVPGTTIVFDGTRDGQPNHTEIVVTKETRKILGVTCVVVRDTVTSNGALVEKTTDWYAQASNGDVWYFGEDTAEYTNGAVSSTAGTWEAGVDNAQPGVVMKAAPKVGDFYRQEYRPGQAEDEAKVQRFDPSIQVPAGTYQNVLVTEDTDPLHPDKIDQKSYAPAVGMVYTKRVTAGHTEESFLSKFTAG